jgi:hypothetical protein
VNDKWWAENFSQFSEKIKCADTLIRSRIGKEPSVWAVARLYSGWIWRRDRKKSKPSLVTGKYDTRHSPVIVLAEPVNYADPTLRIHLSLLKISLRHAFVIDKTGEQHQNLIEQVGGQSEGAGNKANAQ